MIQAFAVMFIQIFQPIRLVTWMIIVFGLRLCSIYPSITDLLDKKTSGHYVEKALQLTEQTILKFKDSQNARFLSSLMKKSELQYHAAKRFGMTMHLPASNSILMKVFFPFLSSHI